MEDYPKLLISVNQVLIILASRKDWRHWFKAIHSSAISSRIWHEIDPTKDPKPRPLARPIRPLEDASEVKWKIHSLDLQEYWATEKARARIHSLIMSSISLSVRDRYDFTDKDLYNIL
jgi:hypothetical protein